MDDGTRAQHLDRIGRDGYTIIEGVLDAESVAMLGAALRGLGEELGTVPAGNSFEGAATWRVYNLLARGDVWWPVAMHPEVLPVVEGVLDHGCLVSSLSWIAIGPGERAQPIHADDQLMPIAKPHVATVCNTMWALTDFTETNGATRLVPGSHRADRSPEYGSEHPSIPAEMAAGSVLVWHGSLWHGGGANATAERRVGIAMNYCAGWVRQQENQQLGVGLDEVRRMPPRLQELCGFGIYRGLIGHIDKRSPAEVLLGARAGAIVWDAI